ncbi:semaphorin-7A [Cottoperca gobio]|uniref:Semaphorin-7A n=1 Tax=Cottoperca gobio TaxID=56716 RepID=A0A6J2P8R9_COTGO|nr:semaphorin-7A-like [Cottoperca gobio]
MALSYLTLSLIFSCLHSLIATSAHVPRMTFTEKEAAMERFLLPGHHAAPVGMFLEAEPDTVIAAGQKHLQSFNFLNPQKTLVEISVLWTDCVDAASPQTLKADCKYNISAVLEREEANKLLVCGTNGEQTSCCDMNLAEQPPSCVSSGNMQKISESIRSFVINEGEPLALVESPDSDLYATRSGPQDYVGIHRFGGNRIMPARHHKEQHYVGLVPIRRRDDPLQSKVFAFYKEKNRDTELFSEMWLPFVSRVCMRDRGGPKNTLQCSWTSQMSARLFCGDPESRQHFSELVDVAPVEAGGWQDTRVYALFRNEWGMSAVCVYTIQDIEHIFNTSPFKGKDKQHSRSRACVTDSTALHVEVLKMIEKNSEMEEYVRPMHRSGPILFNHHRYTHIYVERSPDRNNNHTVLFLSLNNGGIHKVMQNKSLTFVIAEYQPFNHRAHILSIALQTSSRKLYVNSGSELVQLDVENCAQYGNSCEECVLARDPYCGWNSTHCTPHTQYTLQDATQANLALCVSPSKVQLSGKVNRFSSEAHADEAMGIITLPPHSEYFLQCPVSSRHAQYTWRHLESNTSCSPTEQLGLHLIVSMSPEQEGTYTCVSEEMGYSRVRAQYQLQLESRAAGRTARPPVLLCLMAVLLKTLS